MGPENDVSNSTSAAGIGSGWIEVGKTSLDRHCRMKRIDMAIKLDHELRLTRRRSPDMQNFEADLFMMVSRPSEAN